MASWMGNGRPLLQGGPPAAPRRQRRHGQRAALILWTDDVRAGYARLIELGAKPIKTPATWLGRLLIAWVEELAGHLMQVMQAVN
ncbi:hypothetical protein ACTU6V_10480 [Microbacterium sp. A204]|uniref:hypothetical protein n=1 Tax=Microbacterium sp. A204 TaxID=3457321 RepID=UPI003FD364C4